jgi:hypothetical protein
MIGIDEILNEWAFRCHDGIVDVNDPIKVSVLREILEEYEIKEGMLSLKSIQKRPDQFINKFYSQSPFKLGSKGEDDFTIDTIIIGNDTFESINKDEKPNLVDAFRKVSNARAIRLIGQFNGQETTLNIAKIYKSADLGGQEGGSRGVSNELKLVEAINNAIEQNDGDPVTVIFTATEGPDIVAEGIERAEGIGYTGKKSGMKGDVMLYGVAKDQSISIKKDGPYWWSSERVQFADLLNKFIEQGQKGTIDNLILKPNILNPKIFDMVDPRDDKKYGVVLIKNYTPLSDNDTINRIAFGSESAKIVQRSFSDSDFDLQNGTLTIKTTRNIGDIDDLKDEDKPIIWMARHENQTYGIDFRTIPYKQAKFEPTRGGKTLVIDYEKTPSLQ